MKKRDLLLLLEQWPDEVDIERLSADLRLLATQGGSAPVVAETGAEADEANPYQSPEQADAPPEALSNYACPECGRPMEAGSLAPGPRLYWVRPGQFDWVLMPHMMVPGTGPGFLRVKKLPALRCDMCRLILFGFGR